MSKLNGIRLLFISLASISSIAAADMILNGVNSIPTTDITGIQVNHVNGNIMITTSSAYTVTKDDSGPVDANAVSITSFSATPSTITEGESTTISWSTQNADSCAVSDNVDQLNGPVDVSGSAVLTIAKAGAYSPTLTCQGVSGPVSRTLTVTINAPAPTPDPTTNCTASTLSGVTKTWHSFWGVSYPGPGYSNKNATIARSGYMALKFDTGNIVDNGLLVTVGNTITSGVRFGAISECPGDFKVARECDHVWGLGGGISWATNGKTGACQLKPNTTYYFNVTFTDGFDSTSSTCKSSSCVATLQHVNR